MIIIHLFNFRRFKKVPFTNVVFLRELKEETSSRSRLRHLLVLLTRLLAVAFLVLAFAQPYIPSEKQTQRAGIQTVSVFIDNSFSMEAQSREGSRLDIARNRARDIAMSYRPSDRFQVLTNDLRSFLHRSCPDPLSNGSATPIILANTRRIWILDSWPPTAKPASKNSSPGPPIARSPCRCPAVPPISPYW